MWIRGQLIDSRFAPPPHQEIIDQLMVDAPDDGDPPDLETPSEDSNTIMLRRPVVKGLEKRDTR